jgi:hypothetical protein
MTSRNSSPSPVWAGNTPPRIKHAPPRFGDDGLRVTTISERCGLILDRWQKDVIFDALSRDAVSGLWSTPRVAVAVPRQNGKGAIIEALELAFLLGAFPQAKLLIHSAHEFKTAQNGFQRLLSYFDTVPVLSKARDEGRVRIGTAAAREFVEVTGPDGVKRTVKFLARSKGSGRGFSADLLILDEAQELSDEVWAAILPTISARPNPQVWLFGTPPSETMNGEVFTRFREVGLQGDDPRLAYFEWSATDDDDFSDPATWAKANPAFGLRLKEDGIRDEWNSMDEATFCRERLGMFDGSGSLSVIPEDSWSALASELDPSGRVVFAIDVSPDRSRASIGVAGFIDGERVMVQAIENRKGTGWVAPRLAELTTRWPYAAVVLDSGGAAASLLPDLKTAKVRKVMTISTREVVQATGLFYDLAMGSPGGTDADGNETAPMPPRLAHPDQPILNEALASARKRAVGDAWAWDRKNATADITPLVAVTFAAFGLMNKRPARGSSQKVLVL